MEEIDMSTYKGITLDLEKIDDSSTGIGRKQEMMNLDIKAIVNDFPGVAFVLNKEGKFISANNRFSEHLGFYPGKIEGHLLSELDLDLKLKELSLFETLRTGKATYGYHDNLFISYDYKLIYCNLPINLDTGEIGVLTLGIEVIADDNFEEVKIVNFNKNSEIIDVWIVDENHCYIDVTDPYNRFRIIDEELIAKQITEVFPPEYDILLKEAMEERRLLDSKRVLNLGGERFDLQVIAFPLIVDDEVVGGVDILVDLSSRTEIVNQVQQANTIKNVGEMAFRIVHELRNPLQIIGSSAELGELLASKDDPDKEKMELYYNKIKDKVVEINKLLNQLLKFYHSSDLDLQDIEMEELLVEVKKLLNKFCPQYNIEYDVEWGSEQKPIKADKKLLKKALINIVENSIELLQNYNDKKKIEVKSWQTDEEIFISIFNTGPMIPEEIRNTIFDPFTSTKGENGAGLGLSLAFHIIHNLHQGKIWFNSKKEGTTFYISLPIQRRRRRDIK
jgi:signal transduction histidine kinase